MAKKMATKVLFCLVVIAILMSVMPFFVTQTSAVMPIDNYMGKVTGKNNDVLTVQIEYRADYSEPPNWVYYSTTACIQWTVSNSDVTNEIGIGDYIEIAGYLEIGSYGDSVCIGKMKSRTEKVITDVYGDPDYLLPIHAFTKLTGNLNPPLLGDYIIEYENTPDCSKYQDIQTSGCNVYAKYSDVSMPKGNRQLHSQRLYPGQNYVYEDGKCNVDITFNSGEASAYPDCTDQSCFGPQSFSDFTIHVKKIGETKPTPPPTPPPQKPDLTITDLSWSHDSPTSLDLVTYTVEIKNIGTATAEKFWIKILFDDDAEDIDIVESLDPGNSYSQKFYIRKNCGSYSIKANVYLPDFIKEINDNNNIMEKPISIDCGDSIERALIIGISNYQYAPDLGQQAVNSAKGMYNLLRWGYGYDPENVILLLDDEAIFRTIKDEINDMGKITDKNDKIVFYYTGHAAHSPNKEEGIVPYDVLVNDGKLDSNMCILDLDKHFDTNYQGQNVFDGDLIVIFDTCYSGGFCKETDIDDGVPSGINGDKRVVLMSTKAGEELSPWELHYLKFTRYILDAFASHSKDADLNGDLRVSAEEAFEYAKYRGLVLGWLQNPKIMDHYLDESNREAELHISNELVVDEIIAGEGGSSVHIHAYDTDGKHVGTADSGNIVSEIPGAWYSGPASHPEEIIIFGISEDITFMIEGQIDETFNFTVRQFTDVNDIIVNYDDVPIKENAIATVDVSKANPIYTMEIDNNGDGITDYTNEPDSIETIGGVSETKTCKVQITTDPSLQDRPSIVHVNGNYYIAYQSHEKGYGIYIKEFDSNWKFKKKVEVASGSAYYDSPSLLFANNKLYVAYITNANGANANDYDVIVKEYNPSSLSCTKGAKFLTSLQSCQDLPALYHKDGYFYMAYQSWEKGDGDIFIKKFDSDLNMLKKVQVTSKSSLPDRPSITYANGYFYVAYFSEETGYYDIFVKRLDSNLNLASWKEQITTKSSYQSYPFITFVNNQFVISYASTESGTLGIYMKKYG